MRANRTYEFRVYLMSKNPETVLFNAKRLIDVNCKNKNFRYRYNRIVKESKKRFIECGVDSDPMFPIMHGMVRNVVEGERSRKLHNVHEDGVYYCIPVLHFIEDPGINCGCNFNYLNRRVEVSEYLNEISDDEFLEYIDYVINMSRFKEGPIKEIFMNVHYKNLYLN